MALQKKLFVLVLVFLTVIPVFATESFRDGETIWNPFRDNLTATKESTRDPRKLDGIRYYLHDDYNISLLIDNYFVMPDRLPGFMKELNTFLKRGAVKNSGEWPFNNASISINRLTDDEIVSFLRGYTSTVSHNGNSIEVSYVGLSNRSTAMGAILSGDCPDGVTYIAHLLRSLAPGKYEISSHFPKTARVRVGLLPGKAIGYEVKDYSYQFSILKNGDKVSAFYQYPVSVDLKAERSCQIYNLFLPVSYQTGSTKPQSDKISMETLKLNPSLNCSQVLDSSVCDTWVKGKPAVLSAGLNWKDKNISEITTTVTFTENGRKIGIIPFTFKREPSARDKHYGLDRANLVFKPESSGLKEYEALIESAKFKAVRARNSVHIVNVNRKIRIYFMPVAIGSWAGKERLDEELFKKFRNDQMAFIRGLYPLPPEDIIDVSGSGIMLTPQKAYGEAITGISRMSLLARYEALHQPGQVDYAIGIVPADWMADSGVTENRFPHAALISIQNGSYIDSVLAHEIAHLLGFPHNRSDRNADKGVWITGSQDFDFKSLNPKKPALDFMNIDPVNSNQCWICAENYKRLLKIFTTP